MQIQKMKMGPSGRHNKRLWIVAAAVVLLAGAGVAWYFFFGNPLTGAQAAAEATPEYYTSTAKIGDIQIMGSGSGVLIAWDSEDLHFSTSGTVTELNVSVGDTVAAGDVLARIDQNDQLEANVAQAELEVLQAEQALDDLYATAGLSLAQSYQDYLTAQFAYEDAQAAQLKTQSARCSKQVNTQYAAALERAEDKLESLGECTDGSSACADARNNYDTALANYNYCIAYTDDEKLEADANLQIAQVTLKQAETTYNTLKAAAGVDPDELKLAEAALKAAQLKLDAAQETLDGIILVAPTDGTVISIAAGVGERVATDTFISISNLDVPHVQIYLDEADQAYMQVGNPVDVVFDALPSTTFTGTVVQVNPELVEQGPTQLVIGYATLDVEPGSAVHSLPLEANAAMDVISQETAGAVLVPVEALHDLGDGSYSVFVVGDDGELKLRIVQVGLMDISNAEILSGLEAGEVVSTGIVQTAE
jgi:multidrug efflux pump subunit AcrA (membrane-fusion protein)